MLSTIRNLFSPPVFEGDSEKTYQAQAVNTLLWLIISLVVVGTIIILTLDLPNKSFNVIIGLVQFPIYGTLLYFLRRGYVNQVTTLTLVNLLITINARIFLSGGITNPIFLLNLLVIIIAGYLYSRYVLLITMLAMGSIGILFVQNVFNATSTAEFNLTTMSAVFAFIAIASGLLLHISSRSVRKILQQSFLNEKDLQTRNEELAAFSEGLEKLVAERTAALELASLQMERRASQLEAVGEVARSATQVQDFNQLLPLITQVISEQFSYYHVGIFLIDKNKEYAELRAANSEGGKRMLERKHRLRVGVQGLVGSVAYQGKARIALDVGTDAVFFNNSDLPETHSEIALPLIVGADVIGVLDVQSDQRNAFSSEDLEILGTLANQIAVAIENARLFSQTRQALAEAERANQEYVAQEWARFSSQMDKLGYKFSGITTETLNKASSIEEIKTALESGIEQQATGTMAIPVKVRGETIGVIGLQARQANRQWSKDELIIAQAAAERVALALENARLIEDTRKRATIERLTAEIGGKLSSSVRYETILRTTAEEISRALSGAEVLVQLQKSATSPSSEQEHNEA